MKRGRAPRGVGAILKERLAVLRASEKLHQDFFKRLHIAGQGNVWGVDLVVWGVLRRSLLLIDAFIPLVRKGNEVAAVPLLRFQIDNALRLYACSLVPNGDDVLVTLLRGTPLRRLKSRDGKPMTDAFLVEALTREFPWIQRVYERTSGFVHLSAPGLLQTVEEVSGEEVTFSMESRPQGKWRADLRLEATDAFIEATKVLFHVVGAWLNAKTRLNEKWGTRGEAGV